MKITFIIPCYNENPDVLNTTIDQSITTLNTLSNIEYEIIVINDGSTKYSYSEYNNEKVKLITHSHNKGYGATILTGVSASKYEWIAITDADSTYPIDYFPELIKYCDKYDMIVGKRSWRSIPVIRRPAKYILQKLSSFLADNKIPDLNSGMRLFKKEIVKQYIRLFPERFSFTSTITMICLTNGYKVKYVDISYYKRIGLSSIHPIKDTIRFFALVLRLSLYFKPLRFFIPLSLIIVSLAILRGIRDIIVVNSFGGLTLVLFFMAFQVFFFGLIAEIINKK